MRMIRTFLLLAGLGLASLSSAQSGPTVTAVEVQRTDSAVSIVVKGSALARPRVTSAYQGRSLLIDFGGVLRVNGGQRRLAVDRHGVQTVNFGQNTVRPARVRVHVKLTRQTPQTVTQVPGGWSITFRGPQAKAPEPVVNPDVKAMAMAERELARPTAAPNRLVQAIASAAQPVARLATSEGREVAGNLKAALQEAFPESVPPLESAQASISQPVRRGPLVSVEAKDGDVVEILRGLAMQARANIITAPDTSPEKNPRKLTVSLSNVSLEEALNFVTAMSGLKYGRYAGTYVVAPTESFSNAMRQIADRMGGKFETRVVNLRSGEGDQIKEAVYRAFPPSGGDGWYEVIVQAAVPNSATTSTPTADAAAPGGAASPEALLNQLSGGQPGAPDRGAAGAQPPTGGVPSVAVPPSRSRSFYLLVLGEPQRLAAVESYIRNLDTRIADSFAVGRTEEVGTVVTPIFSNQPERIKQLVERILSPNPRAGEFSVVHTQVRNLPEGEESTTVLMMVGPKVELSNLQRIVEALDAEMCLQAGISTERDPAKRSRIYEVVELRFIEPKLAEFDLKSRIRGLWVTILPDHVTPGIQGEAENEKQDAPQDTPQRGQTKVDTEKQKKGVGRESMRLMLYGTRAQIDQAKAYLAIADVPPRQVALELRVMDLSREDAIRAGIDWNIFTGGAVKVIRLNNSQGSPNTPSNTIGGTITGSNWGGDVIGSLDKIANRNNLIARPNAMTMDGRPAELFVGDIVRYVESIQAGQNGVSVTTGEVRVGVQLVVIPRVGDDGSITMTLNPQVSFLRGFTPVPGGGQLPQTSERSVTTTVNLRSGETIAIGGLIQDQDTREVSGVPILMDLPIVGQLFRRTSNNRRRTEIVVFLSARAIENPSEAAVELPAEKGKKD